MRARLFRQAQVPTEVDHDHTEQLKLVKATPVVKTVPVPGEKRPKRVVYETALARPGLGVRALARALVNMAITEHETDLQRQLDKFPKRRNP